MICAVYARKSTEQTGVADEAKSVTRQIEHARAYAARKGWAVADAHVYSDDGISGAEFVKRPGFLRLMNALKPRPPFQALVMSEESRLGREQIETAYALKQITDAGVRVFFYLEDRERTLDSAMDKVMLSLTNFAAEMEREKARQRTYDAMLRKASARQVAGGMVYGYDNVEVLSPIPGADGQRRRQHVLRRINEDQAAVLRRIFALAAEGAGLVRIAKLLNAEAVPPPRRTGRLGPGWAPSAIREMLRRELYRGVIVWNRTRRIDRGGTRTKVDRPRAEWLTFDAPELRIIDEPLWTAVQARLEEKQATYVRSAGGRLWGRPERSLDSPYLLTGFARCALCGGSFFVRRRTSRGHGRTTAACIATSAGRARARTPSRSRWTTPTRPS
jgi:site-specific DNA recombinase